MFFVIRAIYDKPQLLYLRVYQDVCLILSVFFPMLSPIFSEFPQILGRGSKITTD
jgi:hypothetical protein